MNQMLPVTAVFAAILTVIILVLAYRVVIYRRKLRVGFGDGKKEPLKMAISAHSNAVENIPLAIILMLLLELGGTDQGLLVIMASIFIIARLVHAYGLSHSIGISFGRTYGTMVSWLTLGSMAILNVVSLIS